MNLPKDSDEKLLISFSDIFSLLRRHQKMIWICASFMSLLACLYALSRPIHYRAEGSFQELAIKSSGVSNSIMQILSGSGGAGGESEASSMIKSRKLMKEVIKKLHLQANLVAIKDYETLPVIMKNNILLAWQAFNQPLLPALPDVKCDLKIKHLRYRGELTLPLVISLQSEGAFEVFNTINQEKIGEGTIGQPFLYQDLSFTLISDCPIDQLKAQPYLLVIHSLADTARHISETLLVENSKNDKKILKFSCDHRNRHVASQLINEIMFCYQDYLKDNHDQMADKQLEYLHTRRLQLSSNLDELMQFYADSVTEGISNLGFFDTSREMEFLGERQHDYKHELIANELEIKRLEEVQSHKVVYYSRFEKSGEDADIINGIIHSIRDLKQQRDSLEIELQKKSLAHGYLPQQTFDQQLIELHEVQNHLADLRDLIQRFKQGELPNPETKLFANPRFLIKEWFERLQNVQQDVTKGDWETRDEGFNVYLTNLERLFGVHEKILQERLTHQQNPSQDYQGISLPLATQLYLDYSTKIIQMEATIRQNLFFIKQIQDPNFEITSLSSGLEDSISQDIIHKSADLILKLRDEDNQTTKEQERLRKDLQLQRTFLTMHLEQMIQLMELNKELIDEKVYALQTVSVELIHQQISLQENNLQEYIQARLENLRQERSLIKTHLKSIHDEMANIPKKWAAEQRIEQEVEVNQLIVEEIAKMVESKNITHNLELIQSAPVDLALAPVHPIPPKILLYTLAGFLLGSLMGSTVVLGQAVRKGLPVSLENLKNLDFHVSGALLPPSNQSVIHDQDLETLRRMQAYLTTSPVLLIEGMGPTYSSALAHLFAQRGKRVITLDLDFAKSTAQDKGLLQYLNGEVNQPKIHTSVKGDYIEAGGVTRFALELLNAPRFDQLLKDLQTRYDTILVVTKAKPQSAEAESLLSHFPAAVVTLTDEMINALEFYVQFKIDHPQHLLTFIIASNA
jgi:tyrosine-protein kinase Etk/Wzc